MLFLHSKLFDAFQHAGCHPIASKELAEVMGRKVGNIHTHTQEDLHTDTYKHNGGHVHTHTHTTRSDMHQCEMTDGKKEISPYGH